jgi:hypothetical protein
MEKKSPLPSAGQTNLAVRGRNNPTFSFLDFFRQFQDLIVHPQRYSSRTLLGLSNFLYEQLLYHLGYNIFLDSTQTIIFSISLDQDHSAQLPGNQQVVPQSGVRKRFSIPLLEFLLGYLGTVKKKYFEGVLPKKTFRLWFPDPNNSVKKKNQNTFPVSMLSEAIGIEQVPLVPYQWQTVFYLGAKIFCSLEVVASVKLYLWLNKKNRKILPTFFPISNKIDQQLQLGAQEEETEDKISDPNQRLFDKLPPLEQQVG